LAERMSFSESIAAIGISLGVLIIWIGSLVGVIGGYAKATTALVNTGVALVSVTLICEGVAGYKMDKSIKTAMVVMGTILLFVFLAMIRGYGLF
jgi:uncharacterized membrane protein